MEIDWIRRAGDLKPRVRNLIGGSWREGGGGALEKFSARDGQLLYTLGAGDPQDVEETVRSARRAFDDGRWSRLPVQNRKEVLHKLASLIEAHREEVALLESLDVGKPIRDALGSDVPVAASIIRFNAEAADKIGGKVFGADHTSLSYQLIRPIGVVAAIIGWNFPVVLAAQKIGPILATGNSLILKPSELTSLSAVRLAELALEAGVPEGVFNVISGAPGVGAALAQHRAIDATSFTGSTETGKKLMIAAGQSNMKRLVLECGGKAPSIVFDDGPDLEGVADAIVARAYWNLGQVCTASSRLLVQQSIKEALMPLIVKRVAALSPGDPLKPDTQFGAVVSQGHQQKVMSYIDSGQQEGAKILYRSSAIAPHQNGFYVRPVVFDDVIPQHNIAREEIFGPVLSVLTFRDEEEAIRIANDTIYGLSAIVWTRSFGRGHRVAQGLKAGWISINTTDKPRGGPGVGVLSIGGQKQSGLAAEGGIEGLEDYVTKTAVQVFG